MPRFSDAKAVKFSVIALFYYATVTQKGRKRARFVHTLPLLALQDLPSQIIETKAFTVSADAIASCFSVDTISNIKSQKDPIFARGNLFQGLR
jgi:hypothetical protein